MLVDGKEQPLFKQAHVGKFLETSHINTSPAKLGQDNKQTQASLQAGTTHHYQQQHSCSKPSQIMITVSKSSSMTT